MIAYCVAVLPTPDPSHEADLNATGLVAVLATYFFTFFFCVSLGPISWNVCGEVSG